jgi:hypothetical protein
MKNKNFHPEICKLLDMFEDLKTDAQLRANDLMRDDCNRAKNQGCVDAYAFTQLMLRQLDERITK